MARTVRREVKMVREPEKAQKGNSRGPRSAKRYGTPRASTPIQP